MGRHVTNDKNTKLIEQITAVFPVASTMGLSAAKASSKSISRNPIKSSQIPGASVKSDEEEFLRVLEGRAKDGGKLKIVDVGKNEKEVEVTFSFLPTSTTLSLPLSLAQPSSTDSIHRLTNADSNCRCLCEV